MDPWLSGLMRETSMDQERSVATADRARSTICPECGANLFHADGCVRCRECGFSPDRKSTRLNSSHGYISYAVFCLKKKNKKKIITRITEIQPVHVTT